jgi:hypothetical protein
VDERRGEDDVVGLGPEVVGERVSGSVDDTVPHALRGQQRRGVFDRLRQVEDDRAQAFVAAAKRH